MDNILVIVDMQNDFITGPLGNAECEATVPRIVKLLHDEKYDYIYLTKDTHQDNYLDTQEGRNLPVVHCIEGSDGWQIVEDIVNAVDKTGIPYKIINKPTFGSEILGQEIKQLVANNPAVSIDFVGVCTGICVISNAMIAKAVAPETPIRILSNCCACVTPQSHETALDAMKLCQMDIVTE